MALIAAALTLIATACSGGNPAEAPGARDEVTVRRGSTELAVSVRELVGGGSTVELVVPAVNDAPVAAAPRPGPGGAPGGAGGAPGGPGPAGGGRTLRRRAERREAALCPGPAGRS
ncbi:hypothetical protein [Nocardiopsis deserti]|uniref:hypothetical protein n=1 Tax=Nocardiopsis deserti TaxID=2605988 RepID=UPI001239D146|nr:hypothetical protein [Nocardiopsis deserti]